MTTALLGTAAHCCCSKLRPVTLRSSSSSTNPIYRLHRSVAQLGIPSLSPWKGLKHLSISFRRNHKYLVKKEKFNRMVVYASLFGVGAPEALVIGVVALLIFGPKGLAEVARNLGKTLRSFQPTIRELQEVSREFKSSFEREIGLDEVKSTINNSYRSNSVVNESQQTVSDPNGRPVTETLELKKNTEEMSPTTKFQTDYSEEQIRESKSAEVAATTSAPTEESESVSVESKAQTSPLQRTESEEDVK